MGLFGAVRAALPGGGDGPVRGQCAACGREFAFAPGVDDPDCPYCDEAVRPSK